MQCIWTSLARFPSNPVGRVPRFFSSARPFTLYTPSHHKSPIITLHQSRSLHPTTSLSIALAQSLSPSLSTSKWTPPSRLSLSAANAVRVSLNQHALEDAFMIVNNIRYAALSESERESKDWHAVKRSHVTVPTGVSSRLPAHVLLHGLVRIGMPQQASHLATSMMTNGVRVRGRTLERIMDGLSKAATVKNFASEASNARLRDHMGHLLGTAKVLTLDSAMTSDPNVAFALKLLHAARKSRSQRTGAMFNTLITLCLINGEIIIASLLFGFLVKDWERRSQTLSSMTSRAASDLPPKPSPQPSNKLNKAYHYDLLTKNMRPTHQMLRAIVSSIGERLEHTTPEAVDDPNFQEAIQALANLAVLLNDQQLPFPQISSLLRALYRCPRMNNWVWVKGKEGPVYVPAYQYFHQSILNLIKSLPTHRTHTSTIIHRSPESRLMQFKLPHPVQHMQPPLDLASYNALMHYAFRHRFSPSLAREIYKHMTVKREPPLLGTSIDTYNIHLRSAALYRQRDVVGNAVQILSEYNSTESQKEVVRRRPKFMQLHRNLKHARHTVFQVPSTPTVEQLLEDQHALSTYLSTLVSCGQPGIVVQFMRSLLPVFQLKPLPSRHVIPDPERKQKWNDSLVRAVKFGPYVLCTFLHALVKSGITRETHKLFKLIVRASDLSQDPDSNDIHKPWHVTTAIYTTMMHAYKTEFTRCRQRTGTRILDYLLRKTTALYQMAKADVTRNIPGADRLDPRFYNAVLKILAEYLPEKQRDIVENRRHLIRARQQYAKTGFFDEQGRLSLVDEVVEDMNLNGYPIPTGFHRLFINEGTGILDDSHNLPDFDRRPFAFSLSKRVGTPYTLPTSNRKSLFVIRRNPFKSIRRSRLAES